MLVVLGLEFPATCGPHNLSVHRGIEATQPLPQHQVSGSGSPNPNAKPKPQTLGLKIQ